MVKEILNKALAKLLGQVICRLPKELSDEIFWEIYQQWFKQATGPLHSIWKGHDCVTDFMDLADEMGWEWSQFKSAKVTEIVKRCNEVFDFQNHSKRAA